MKGFAAILLLLPCVTHAQSRHEKSCGYVVGVSGNKIWLSNRSNGRPGQPESQEFQIDNSQKCTGAAIQSAAISKLNASSDDNQTFCIEYVVNGSKKIAVDFELARNSWPTQTSTNSSGERTPVAR